MRFFHNPNNVVINQMLLGDSVEPRRIVPEIRGFT